MNDPKEPILQHRAFIADQGNDFALTGSVHEQIVTVLSIAESAVNKAIKEGASKVTISYVNIKDAIHNPDGINAELLVIGYKYREANTP